jgi:hypothetical protein
MALENFDCPQFVDFTSIDAFNNCDNADFFFGKLSLTEMPAFNLTSIVFFSR